MWKVGIAVIKKILISLLSEKFLEWMFFWAASALVESTKTTKDDEFLKKAKEVYEQS